MNVQFDYFGRVEFPFITLANPNKSEIASLGLAYNTNLISRFNALSEFSFSFPRSIDAGVTYLDAYDYIRVKRLVNIENQGWFVITEVEEDQDGIIDIKNVKCQSLEFELAFKKVTYSGTKKLWDAISPSGTILNDIVSLVPTWSVGTIDTSLTVKYRTFSISDKTIYDFLLNDVSKSFDCIFIFDSVNKTISATSIENATTQTDVFLSFENVISKSQFKELSDELISCLSVFGGNSLDIRLVNPLGTNKLYSFYFYATSDWMNSDLVSAIVSWKALVDSKQTEYANLLTTLRTYKSELIVLQGELSDLQSQLTVLETTKSVRIQGNQSLGTINAEIAAKEAEISAKQIIVANKQSQIDSTTADLIAINDEVSFENNFSPSQLLELDSFIFESTYQNNNIIRLDSMTEVELQDASQDLHDQAVDVLEKISQPRYELTLDAINYVSLPEFSVFTNQTVLGMVATLELKDGTYVETVLLQLEFSFDDPANFKMTFSNRLRLDGEDYKYSDLMGEVISTGSQVSFNSAAWSDWNENYKDEVSGFISSSLNASLNNIISNSNQEIKIDQTGIRGRKSDGSGGYLDDQIWITNNTLAFSDDGFNTAKLVLGQVTTPSGGTAFGLVGDLIVGRMIAGNNLVISNSSNNFTLDGSGATLNNAKFNIQTTNTKITIDPTATNSFVIQKNVGGTWTNRFVVNNTGDVTFSGTLSGASGSFSGSVTASSGTIGALTINSQGLQNSTGSNYLRGNDLKWGALSITGSTAVFDGTIYANKISGQVTDSQIGSGLNASKVTFGTMSADRIYGGTIAWPGVAMGYFGYGWSYIQFTRLSLNGGNSYIELDATGSGYTSIYGGGGMTLTTNWGVLELEQTYLYSNISGDGGYGYNDSFRILTPSGYMWFTFDNGLLVNVHS